MSGNAHELLTAPLLLHHNVQERPIAHRLECGTVAAFSDVRPGAERPNEDSAAVVPLAGEGVVLAIADGAGGHRSGADASRTAIEQLVQAVQRDRDRSLRTRVLDGFEAANASVRALGVGALTTLAVVTVVERELRAHHVGDSTVLVTGQRGRIKLQTIDHTPVGYAVEAGVLDESEAMVHEERHLLTNVLGSEDMRIDIGPSRQLGVRDTVVLGSDGLFDNLTIDEIVQITRIGSLDERTAQLVALAAQRMDPETEGPHGKPDDLTVLVYRPSA